jgi:hypothetical protein
MNAHISIASQARKALFTFIVTFVISRVVVWLIMSGHIPNLYLFLHGTHIHHLNYGIFLLAVVAGYSVLCRPVGCHFAGENQPLICGSKSPTPEALVSYQVCCADQARS